jgi:hypothetical protein
MLEKSLEYSHQLNIRLLNNEPNIQHPLVKNELFDTNITNQQKDEILEIELITNHVGGGNFLLYFQGKNCFSFLNRHSKQLFVFFVI